MENRSRELACKSENDWELRILETYPGRASGETCKEVALRLKREVLLGRAFVQSIHSYICKDAETRTRVKQILKQAGVEEFSGVATPEGALKASLIWLVPHLSPIVGGFYPAVAIASVALVLAVLGLDAICRSSSDQSHKAHEKPPDVPRKGTKQNRVAK
jgi:hypothetical protein